MLAAKWHLLFILLSRYLILVHIFLTYFLEHSLLSLLYIETADRAGLLLEIIKILSDINVTVESAEIDTEVCMICIYFCKA